MNSNTNTKVALAFTAVLVLIVVVFVGVVLIQSQSRPVATPDPVTGLAPSFTEDSHRLTDPEGSTITFVEFLDFECEACGAVFPYVEELRAEYGDRVTFIMRYFPLPSHFNAENAAIAVEAAARQGRLEDMYVRMFETQGEWGEKQESEAPRFRTYAEELGLDLEQFDADVADPDVLARVMADLKDGRALGIDGTPAIFVNDVRIELSSIDDIRTAVESALKNE